MESVSVGFHMYAIHIIGNMKDRIARCHQACAVPTLTNRLRSINDPGYSEGDRTNRIIPDANGRKAYIKFVGKLFLEFFKLEETIG